jgi:hapalindole biogenesis HpiC1 cyclase-like protein
MKLNFTFRIRLSVLSSLSAGLLTLPSVSRAQPLSVPNFSFENPTVPNIYPYVSTIIDSWQKNPQPGYFNPVAFGLQWDQTSGVFLDNFAGNPAPLSNRDGNQGAYIFDFPGAGFHQDYNSSAIHDLNVTYNIGESYRLTAGILGKGVLAPGDMLLMNLYYGDYSGGNVVSSTYIAYDPATFSDPTKLVDFSVNVSTVQASDAWANQTLGISLTDISGPEAGTAYWDIDNVRLEAVPEPGSLSLLLLGSMSWYGLQARRRQA